MSYHVGIDDKDRGREGVLLVDEPVLMEGVQVLQVVERHAGLLAPVPLLHPLQRLLRGGSQVDDQVDPDVEPALPGGEVVPLVEHLELAALHHAGLVHVLDEAVARAVDRPLHQLDCAARPRLEVVLQHGQLHVGLEGHRPPDKDQYDCDLKEQVIRQTSVDLHT